MVLTELSSIKIMDPNQTPGTTPEPVVTPAPTDPSGQPVNQPGRDAIIAKYEQTYFTPAEPEPAPAEPVETPAPVVETPAPATDSKDAILQQLMAELQDLKKQVTPAPAPATPVTQDDWLKLLSEGKKSEGEKALAEVLGPQIQEAAVQKALALMQAERAVTEFTNEIRTSHSDLMDMEGYISLGVNARIQAAQSAGRIQSPADYVTVYKEAVNTEIENARKISQKFQGAGAQRATTRTTEVVASQTLKSNPVNTQREQPAAPKEPAVETVNDYFAKRRAQHASFSGLSQN